MMRTGMMSVQASVPVGRHSGFRVKHRDPECKGCGFGDRQYCVGLCWKDAYDSVLNKRYRKAEEPEER